MDYEINFDSATSADAVAAAVHQRYQVPAALIYTGREEDLATHTGPDPVVVVFVSDDPDNAFGCCMQAGDALAQVAGYATQLDMATRLCAALDTRAIVDDGGDADLVWMLVTPDGWHGRVVVDENGLDEGRLHIEYAYQTVPSAPDIEVRTPPDWETSWYPNGQIPA